MSKRIERVNELIKNELSLIMHREFAENLGMVVVNLVETERDLKSAKVYVSGFTEEKSEYVIKKLQLHAHTFQQALGKRLIMKNIPKLQFIFDKYQKNIDKIQELISVIEKEKSSRID